MDDNDDNQIEAVGKEAQQVQNLPPDMMTQDLIEWNEGDGVDLRQIHPSPHPSGTKSKISLPRTDSSQKSTSSSIFFGNDAKQPYNQLQHQQKLNSVNLDGTFQQMSNPQRRPDRPIPGKKHEYEIDGILGILDNETRPSESSCRADECETISDVSDMKNSVSPAELPTQHRHNKRRAAGEIERHKSHPQQDDDELSSFVLHNRRRRVELRDHRQNKQSNNVSNSIRRSSTLPDRPCQHHAGELPSKKLVRNNTVPSQLKPNGTASRKNDGFMELLDALATPRVSQKRQPSRPPLGSVDDNVSPSQSNMLASLPESSKRCNIAAQPGPSNDVSYNVSSGNQIKYAEQSQSTRVSISPHSSLSPNCSANGNDGRTHTRHPEAVQSELHLQQTVNASTGASHKASRPLNEKPIAFSSSQNAKITRGADPDDEFDDVPLSAIDLAMFDAIAEASLVDSGKQALPVALMKRDQHEECDRCRSSDTDESEDEYGDFPVQDEDFNKIDDLVATKIGQNGLGLQSQSNRRLDPPEVTHGSANVPDIHHPVRSEDSKSRQRDEDDDEFGDLPLDMDFGKIDALIASQTVSTSTSNRLSGGSDEVPIGSEVAVHGRLDDDDEYEGFPAEIDFSCIDAIVESRRKKKSAQTSSHLATKDPSRVAGCQPNCGSGISYPRFSRYRVLRVVEKDNKSNTQIISVYAMDDQMLSGVFNSIATSLPSDGSEDGLLSLRGEWYFAPISSGDCIHVCSLTGRYRTDKSALPMTLDTFPSPAGHENDLVLVLHPDKMMSPSIISEASYCNRRAVLKAKLGSTGFMSKSALVGTLVHGLFEECIVSEKFDKRFAQETIRKLLRDNAETLIGCGTLEDEVSEELLGVVPMIQRFASRYTTLIHDGDGDHVGGVGPYPNIFLKGRRVHSVEEGIVSVELGLKGQIDAVLEAEITAGANGKTGPISSSALLCLELKTGHNQIAQKAHLAQLALYTIMLRGRYGTQVQPQQHQSCASGASSAGPGGVLLYLNQKAESIYHVAPEIPEVKSLISCRNVVVSGLERACAPRGISLSYDEGCRDTEPVGRQFAIHDAPPADFPDLKEGSHSCKRCFSNRECMLYAASGSASDTSKHSELMSQFTGHLQPVDLEYFRTWDRLLDIEAGATTAQNLDPKRVKPRHEEVSGYAFDPQASFTEMNGRNASVFFRRYADTNCVKFIDDDDIAPGSNVLVSTLWTGGDANTSRGLSHILKGVVEKCDRREVSISCTLSELALVKQLVSRHRQSTTTELKFQIVKSVRSVGTGTLRWNLINFLTGDGVLSEAKELSSAELARRNRLPWLRDMLIRLEPPRFDAGPSPHLFDGIKCHIPGCHLIGLSSEFIKMNYAQQQAVRKCMGSRDYTLIQGLPGTGKSSTLAFLARLLVAHGRRVLISAYTHSAVDNIMLKLIESGMGRDPLTGLSPLVRLGQRKSCHKGIGEILCTELAKETNVDLVDDQGASSSSLQKVVSSSRVVGVTALSSSRSALLLNEEFDVVILDEAGQINQPAALGPLMAAKLFVLVGDHKQLPPLVNSEIAEKGGYGISMLSRLAEEHPTSVAPLTLQYRMNEAICKVSSEAFYGGKMKCADDNVKHRRLALPGFPANLVNNVVPWVEAVVDPQNPVIFVDTDQIRSSKEKQDKHVEFEPLEGRRGTKTGGSTINETEKSLVFSIVDGLIKGGLDPSDVGVISPFRAQIRIMEENPLATEWKRDGLELSTIDKYQGRDKSAIILSMVRSNRKCNTGRLLQDPRRLNVALTRAKCKLIIIGSFKTLSSGSAPLRPILNRMKRRNQLVLLPEDAGNKSLA